MRPDKSRILVVPKGVLILVIFAAVKITLLATYGPLTLPDTKDYVAIAEAILRDPAAFSRVPDWSASAMPLLAFRPYGYPLVIATAKLIGGSAYGHLLVVGQISLTIYVGKLMFDFIGRLCRSRLWAVLALVFYLSCQTILWDQCILTDSLYSSLFNIVMLKLVGFYLDDRSPGVFRLSGLSLLWACSVLTRDSGIYFTVIPCAILSLLVLTPAVAWSRRLVLLAAFLLPMAAAGAAYVSWNHYRTGEAFFGIAGVANFMRPAFDLARAGWARPFDDASTVSSIISTHSHDYGYPEQVSILQKLHDELRLTSPTQLLSLVQGIYFKTMVHYPIAYARFVLENMDPRRLAGLIFDPFETYNAYYQLGVPPYARLIPGDKPQLLIALARQGEYAQLALALAALIARTISTVILVAGVAAVLVLADRERRTSSVSREMKTALLLLACSIVVLGFYALVHSETRLELPVVPAVLAVSACGFSGWVAARKAARERHPQPS